MTVAEDIAAILTELGGRTACAARLFRPGEKPSARQVRQVRDDGETAPDMDLQVALNAGEAFPAAGLAKLPIAVEFLRRADLGQFDLAERWDTSDEPRAGGSGVLDLLDPATPLTLGDLCTLMLVANDDTAANILLDLVGMGEVNESASRMKLNHTRLERRFMDFAARAARRDNVTSAHDMLALLTLIQRNMLPGASWLRETLSHQQRYAELSEAWLPQAARLAHMDGLLPDATHDTGLLSGPLGTCAYSVLTAEQNDIPAARYATARIVRLLWDAWLDGGSIES
jgi:beta-lactamase class A